MTSSDLELLREYGQNSSEDAFAALVNRHLNLVYSAALRQVRSPQLAEEVSQSVFTDLARNAQRLASDTVLSAWLYQVTRRTAIDVVRREVRRQLREQIATEMNTMNASDADWTQIEPLLDEAMDALNDTDRAAVLLRYFGNKSLREVGQTLGTSDDAAQKRVSRAVERLREFFAKRGVTVGAGGLAIVISANAVQSAPAGFAATITASAIAGTTVATATTATITKAIAMTTLQKTFITTMFVAIAGAGIFEARRASLLQSQVQTLQQQQAPLTEQINDLQRERNDATNRLVVLADENARAKNSSNELELLRLRHEIGLLKRQKDEVYQQWMAAKRHFVPLQIHEMSPTNFPVNYPQESMVFMGYSQPEASLETLMWAFREGNQQVIMSTLSPKQGSDGWQKLVNAESADQLAEKGVSFMNKIAWMDITKKEIVSDNEALFTISIVPISGTQNAVIRKVAVYNMQGKWRTGDLIQE